jgi:hypothetical protein
MDGQDYQKPNSPFPMPPQAGPRQHPGFQPFPKRSLKYPAHGPQPPGRQPPMPQ